MNELELRRYIDRNIADVRRTITVGNAAVAAVAWTSVKGRPDMSRYLLKAEAAALYLPKSEAAELYLTRGTGGQDGMTRNEIAESYWSRPEQDYFSGGITSLPAELSQYQTIAGMSEYQTISGMTAYLGTGEAAMTYQTIEGMTAYLGTETAASTYQPISGMTEYLGTAEAAETYQEKLPIDPEYGSDEKYLAEDGEFREISGESFVTKTAVDNAIGATGGIQGGVMCLYNDTGEWSTVSMKEIGGNPGYQGLEINFNTQSDTVQFEPMYFSSNTRMISSVLDSSRYLYVPNITLEYESSGDYGLTVDSNYATIINAGTVNSRLETSESDIYALDGRLTTVEADLGTANAVLQQVLNGGN